MIKARIRQFNGGRYGRTGEWIAMIEPEFFKNGNMKNHNSKLSKNLKKLKSRTGAQAQQNHGKS